MNRTPLWTFRLRDERRVGARRPVIADGIAHLAFTHDKGDFSGSTLFALDSGSGSRRWSRTIEHIGNEPVVADGSVYWSSFEGSIHALDREGRTVWKSPGADANIGVPVLGNDGRLFVSEIAGGATSTWCLDRATGRTLWRFAHGGHAYRLCYADDHLFHSSVSGGTPGVPTRATLYSLVATDGRVAWSVSGRDYLFDPVVLQGRLTVCSSRSLLVYDAASGQRLAEAGLGPDNATSTLAPCSLPDQPIVWEDHAGQEPDVISAFAARTVKRLFGGERLELTRAWRLEEPRRLCEAPIALSADRLIYLTHDGTLCTIARETGARLSERMLKTRPSATGGLAIADARLVITHGRHAFAFDGI